MLRGSKRWLVPAAAVAVCAAVVVCLNGAEWVSGKVWPEPKVIEPGDATHAPSDAVVLFDGKDLSQWEGGDKWIIKDGYAVAFERAIKTKQGFGSCQLHIEFATPEKVEGDGQGRGNNGVLLMGNYEVQILDSYNNKTYFDGQCASVYKQYPPLVNACRKPGEWQSYDIVFEAPKFEKGKVARPGYITVLHNGVIVQNHVELQGTTAWHKPPEYAPHADKVPLELFYHGNPVKFRNIWIRELGEMKPLKQK
jgi:hypothetical protein